VPSVYAIEVAFLHLLETSNLCRYIIDQYIYYHGSGRKEDLDVAMKYHSSLPGEFLGRIIFGYKDKLAEKILVSRVLSIRRL